MVFQFAFIIYFLFALMFYIIVNPLPFLSSRPFPFLSSRPFPFLSSRPNGVSGEISPCASLSRDDKEKDVEMTWGLKV